MDRCPSAPAVIVWEEDVLKNYPITYRELADTLKQRYVDFRENKDFHRIRQILEKENKYCICSPLAS